MFEYIATLVGMHETDKILMAEAQAKESNKTAIVQMGPPRPAYRVPRDQRFEVIRKRFEQQLKDDEKIPDPHADMWDKDWVNKP
jgi:hypothetical protein